MKEQDMLAYATIVCTFTLICLVIVLWVGL